MDWGKNELTNFLGVLLHISTKWRKKNQSDSSCVRGEI